MSHRFPTDDRLSEIIAEVMKKNNQIRSQSELTKLVRRELEKDGADFRVGPERIRRVGIDKGVVRISIEYRESDLTDLPDFCPVCKNAMDPILNRSLEGDIVEVKRKCSVCPYSISGRIKTPGRYIFLKAAPNLSDRDLRSKKLKNARAKITEATKLITDALHMSGLEERGQETVRILKEVSNSKEMSCSLYNINADLKESKEEDIVWTKPLISPKNKD